MLYNTTESGNTWLEGDDLYEMLAGGGTALLVNMSADTGEDVTFTTPLEVSEQDIDTINALHPSDEIPYILRLAQRAQQDLLSELPMPEETLGNYYGVYDSVAAFAEDHARASVDFSNIPADIQAAINWHGVGEKMKSQGFTILTDNNGNHYCWTE